MNAVHRYEFGRFRLDADGRLLYRDDARVQLTPKAIDLLVALLEKRGTAVSREHLLLTVWHDAAVEEGTLTSHISLLRKTLGEGFIETIPKRGYRFTAEVQTARPPRERHLLLVLPFQNLGGSKKNESFADGLTEELITQLGRADPQRLGVIARTSSMTYKSTDKTIEQIGRELGASHVLEGSVRRAGGRVRISAQLIQVSDQTHLWADTYDAELEDILSVQSDVSRAVASQIQIRLMPAQPARRIVPEAYEAHLLGRYLWSRRNQRDVQSSIRSFQTAIEKDPGYAPPYAGLADVYMTQMDGGYLSMDAATSQSRPLAMQALILDPHLAEAHVTLGHVAMHEFNWKTAEGQFRLALDENPNAFSALYYYSNYLVTRGALDEAIRNAEEARRLDPVSPAAILNLSAILWHAGRNEEAIAHANRVLEIDPDNVRAWEDLGRAKEQLGRFEEAIEAFRNVRNAPRIRGLIGYTHALAGNHDAALKILGTSLSAYESALIFVALARNDEAIAALETAAYEHSSAVPFLKVNPHFAPLRRDKRFQSLVRRIGLH